MKELTFVQRCKKCNKKTDHSISSHKCIVCKKQTLHELRMRNLEAFNTLTTDEKIMHLYKYIDQMFPERDIP